MYQILGMMYKGSKVHSKVGIDPQSLSYGFLNKIMDHTFSDGVLKVTGPDVPNLMNNVPNFMKEVPRVPSAFRGGDQPPITFLWVSK